MRHEPIKQYLALRESLLEEQASLEARLAEINKVLGDSASLAAPNTNAAPVRVRRVRRRRNALTLKTAIAQVTRAKPLRKEAILAAVRKVGYRFATRNPMATLNSVLYAKRQFKNEDGRFSPAK